MTLFTPWNRKQQAPAPEPEAPRGASRRPFSLSVALDAECARLELTGQLGADRFDALEAGLRMVAELKLRETRIDVARLERIDTFAVGILCGFAQQAEREGCVTRLRGATGRVAEKLSWAESRGQLAAVLEA